MRVHHRLLTIMIFPLLVHRAFGAPVRGTAAPPRVDDSSASVSTLLGDLAQLRTDLTTMDADVKSFTGSFRGVLAVTLDEAKVEQDLDRVTDDVRGSSPFTAGDSHEVVEGIVALDPIVVSLLSDVVAKVPPSHSPVLITPSSTTPQTEQ